MAVSRRQLQQSFCFQCHFRVSCVYAAPARQRLCSAEHWRPCATMESPPEQMASNKMGLLSCTSYVVGNIIGSGIFITPGAILTHTGSAGLALVVWAGCGLISLIGALTYIELATAIPDPGCDFAYVCFVGWEAFAFAIMWVSTILTFPACGAVQAKTFAQYIIQGFNINVGGFSQSVLVYGIGFTVLVLLTFLNFYSLERYAAKFQLVVTIAKMLSMAVIIVTGFYLLIFRGWTSNFDNLFANSNFHPGSLTLAFYGGLWSYAGWDVLNYGTPEIYRPKRTMPYSLISGLLIVLLTYIAINIAFLVVLNVEEIKNSEAVAADFAHKVLGNFRYAVPFMIAILLVGTLNSNIFVGSRVMQAAAARRHLPPFVSCIHPENGSPRPALLCQALITIGISFVDTDTLINYVTFVMWGQRIVTMSALLWIRYKKMPVDSEALKMPLALSVLFLLISTALVVVPLWQETMITIIGIVIVASGLVFYYPFVRSKSLPPFLASINSSATETVERLLYCKASVRKVTLVDLDDGADEQDCMNEH